MAKDFFQSMGLNRQVLALSSARMADAIGNSILFIVIPLYVAKLPSETLHFAVPVLVGLLISMYGLISSTLQPIMGALSDRIGRRKLMIQTGLALMGLGTLGFSLADRFLHLMILRGIQGIAISITVPAALALMAVITTKETRGGSMGIYSTLRMIGFAVGPLIGGALQVHFGFNAAFFVGAGFILIAIIMVQLWIKEVPLKNNPEEGKPRFKIIDRSLLNPGIFSAAAATFIMAYCFTMVTTLENEFNSKLSMNALQFSIAFSSMMISRLLLQIPLGRVSDKIGRRPLIIIGLILMAPTTALMGEATTMMQLTLLRVIQGVAAAGIVAPAFALVADLGKSGGEGRQMSVVTVGFTFGMAIGPLLAGALSVIFFELPFFVGGILSLIGAGVVYRFMPETIKRQK